MRPAWSKTWRRGRRTASRSGEPVRLTRKEFGLLFFLASRQGTTFARSRLLEEVWDFAIERRRVPLAPATPRRP